MRATNNDIKDYINKIINEKPNDWIYYKGKNFGIALQEQVGNYYYACAEEFEITDVKINTNPNDTKPDVVVMHINGTQEWYEVKSCKDGALSGVTICNSPHLLNDRPTFLINYTVGTNKVIQVVDVYQTELFRLTSINSRGMYAGCLRSTRDTGKKIKGRTFNDFIRTPEEKDYTLEQLTEPTLIRKTILYHSVSKLIDQEYNFTDEEILEAIRHLKENN